jgi:CRP/FNR family transcriptional regulator
MKNLIDFYKKVTIFSNLTEEQYRMISEITKLKHYRKKETVFNDGEEANGFYIVYSGRVKIYKVSFDGREQILHIFGKHQIFGEVPVFSNKVFPATATTLENSEIIFIPKERFISLVNEHPQIALQIIGVLSMRLHAFTNVIENLSLKEIPSRLASYIIYLKEKSGEGMKVELEVNKSQLSSILGTIPETLSRIFTKMSQNNILEIKGKFIIIKDFEKLDEIANGFEKL